MAALSVHQVPEHFHEMFILSGYRNPSSSITQCLRSMFQPTNETLNIWTHLIPTVYFIFRVFCVDSWRLELWDDPYCFPMICFLLTICLYPAASCAAHIFNALSDNARHICFFIDYWALSLYSLGAAICYRAYAFPVDLYNTRTMDLFIWIGVLNALISFAISCRTRFLPNGFLRKFLRSFAFGMPYLYDCYPVIYRCFYSDGPDWNLGGIFFHIRQFIFAFLSAFLYTSHFPECLKPGTFDIIGHSHQIFHVMTILGSHDQMFAAEKDMLERKQLLISHGVEQPSYCFSILAGVAIFNLIVLIYFSRRFLYKSSSPPCKNDLSPNLVNSASNNASGDANNVRNIKKHE